MIELSVPDWWLTAVGFTRGNPFSVKEADTDPLLGRCFREKSYFYDLRGDVRIPRTAFLVADRGSGKSANRRILEQQCREGILGELVLAVPYLQFGFLGEKAVQGTNQVTARMHVEEILKQAIPALLELLKEQPTLVQRLYPSGYRMLLKWFLIRYTDILSLDGIDNWLQHIGLLSKDINAQRLFDAADNKTQRESFEGAGPSQPVIELLVDMIYQAPASLNPADISHVDMFKRFTRMVNWLGVKAIYVFVDRIDESFETATDPIKGADLIEPLIADLHLMEMSNVAFKFFVPSRIADELRRRQSIRLDRLLFREISWTTEDLMDILERRVQVYSDNLLPNLEQLCVPQLSGINRFLADHASGSPRNLLRLGEWLLHHHVSLSKGDRLINQEDLNIALGSFEDELDDERGQVTNRAAAKPKSDLGLSIDKSGAVLRAGKILDVKLSKLEYDLLSYLCQNPEKLLSREDLIEAVYGEDALYESDDRALYALIGRLRKKVEDTPERPRYIKTIPSLGYRFEPFGKPE